MGKLKCGCVIADSRNTSSVRKGIEVGGYVKEFCEKHSRDDEDSESEIEDKEAALCAAKMVFNYIQQKGLSCPCLIDNLADFIGDLEGS